MKSCILLSTRCFLNREDVSTLGKIFNLFSTHTYDGEGKVANHEHLHNFISMIYEENKFTNEQESLLLAFALHESPFHWMLNLLAEIVHSFDHFYDLIQDMFYHFDLDHLD